jgi:hypothetical protein
MYRGIWKYDCQYQRGDIVYFSDNLFLCNMSHSSCILTAPSKEDIYWIPIDFDIPGMTCNIEIDFGGESSSEDSEDSEGSEGSEGSEDSEGSEGPKPEGPKPEGPKPEELPPVAPAEPPVPKKEDSSVQTGDPSNLPQTFFILNDLINNILPPRPLPKLEDNPVVQLRDPPMNPLKRKLLELEEEVNEYNKRIKHKNIDLRDRLLLLNVDIETKAYILSKYDEQIVKMSGSDRAKGTAWVNTICNMPFGVYKNFPVTKDASLDDISTFFQNIRDKMDGAVHGHEHVKDEIMEFVAKCVSNPNAKGQILALCGYKGTGKTKLIKKGLSEALGLPFFQINFGGMTDANILVGHDMTYIGSKPGKLVEILTKAQCMNPIIYLDEIDKVSESKAREIFGVLTHLLDHEQNHEFIDNYLHGVKIDLSKVLFVIAFNEMQQVDHIVSDRMKVITIGATSVSEKVEICKRIVIPEMCKEIGLTWVPDPDDTADEPEAVEQKAAATHHFSVHIDAETLKYIITKKVRYEEGVRQLKRALETIFNKLNIDILLQRYMYANEFGLTMVNPELVDRILKETPTKNDFPEFMYS